MDKLKAQRAAAASLAALLVSVPVGILALAISKAVKTCRRPAEEQELNKENVNPKPFFPKHAVSYSSHLSAEHIPAYTHTLADDGVAFLRTF